MQIVGQLSSHCPKDWHLLKEFPPQTHCVDLTVNDVFQIDINVTITVQASLFVVESQGMHHLVLHFTNLRDASVFQEMDHLLAFHSPNVWPTAEEKWNVYHTITINNGENLGYREKSLNVLCKLPVIATDKRDVVPLVCSRGKIDTRLGHHVLQGILDHLSLVAGCGTQNWISDWRNVSNLESVRENTLKQNSRIIRTKKISQERDWDLIHWRQRAKVFEKQKWKVTHFPLTFRFRPLHRLISGLLINKFESQNPVNLFQSVQQHYSTRSFLS